MYQIEASYSMPTYAWNGGWHAVLAYSSIASSPGYWSASPASWSSTAKASYSCDASHSTTATVVSSSLSTLKQSPTSRSRTLVSALPVEAVGDADSWTDGPMDAALAGMLADGSSVASPQPASTTATTRRPARTNDRSGLGVI